MGKLASVSDKVDFVDICSILILCYSRPILYYIIRFSSLCTCLSFQQKFFGAMCTIFNALASAKNELSENFA